MASPSNSRLISWIKALRLPFYPLSGMGYTLGASLMVPVPELWSHAAYWLGLMVVFLVEALTVFLNDLHDFESDRRNANHGAFTGGSRVLVDGRLSRKDLMRSSQMAAAGIALTAPLLQYHSPAPAWMNVLCLGIALILGIGYTVPPLKLSHRGCGEIAVSFSHSFLVIQAGALVVGGENGSAGILTLALPLFFAIFPSITLSGLPDREADESAGKRTLAVKLGQRPVLLLSAASSVVSCVLAFENSGQWEPWMLAGIALHAVILTISSLSLWRRPVSHRIDWLMMVSLSYVLWFVLGPLLA